jgi:hypothetical protein
MDHVWPPKEIATLTDVEQAMENENSILSTQNWYGRDVATHVEIMPSVIASTRSSIGDRRIQGSDLGGRSANERCSGVDRQVRNLARRKCYRVSNSHSGSWWGGSNTRRSPREQIDSRSDLYKEVLVEPVHEGHDLTRRKSAVCGQFDDGKNIPKDWFWTDSEKLAS